MADLDQITQLITLASSDEDLAVAQHNAKKAWKKFPHNGCAANLSALLQMAGIDVPMILGAGHLAEGLKDRGWKEVSVGDQEPGDVGVTFDNEPSIPGADHIYLVVRVIDDDEMLIADNRESTIHTRFASGRGRTPTEYFLRAT